MATISTEFRQFRTLFEAAPDAYFLSDQLGQFIDGNTAIETMLGYSREELIGESFRSLRLLSVRHIATTSEWHARFARGEATGPEQILLVRRSGSEFTVEAYTQPITLDGKDYVLGRLREDFAQDTELENPAEELLRESEQRLMTVVASAPVVITSIRPDGRIDLFDGAGLQKPGLEPGAFEGEDYFKIWKDYPQLTRAVQRALAGELPPVVSSLVNDIVYESRCSPVYDSSGFVAGAITVCVDVTERERAEQVVRRSERELRLITDNVPALISYVGADQRYRFANRRMQEILSMSVDQIVGKRVSDVLGSKIYESIRPYIETALTGQRVEFDTDAELPGKGRFFFSVSYLPDIDESNNTKGFYVLIRDISERKQAESERETRIRHLQALDRINQLIVGAPGIDKMLTDVLDAILEILGCDRVWLCYPCDPATDTVRMPLERTRSAFPGVGKPNVDFPVDDRHRETMRQLLDSDDPMTFCGDSLSSIIDQDVARRFEVRSMLIIAIRPRKGAAWTLGLHQCTHERVFSDADKRLIKDISRRLEDALTSLLVLRELSESEEQYRLLLENHVDGVSVILDGKIAYANDPMCALCGFDREEMIGKSPADFLLLSDRARAVERIAGLMRGASPLSSEYTICHKQGHPVTVEITSRPVLYQQRRALLSVLRDITERKQAEQSLKRSELRLRMVTDHIPAYIAYLDTELRFRFVNKRNAEFKQSLPEEIVGKRLQDVIARERFDFLQPYIKAALNGEEVEFEATFNYGHHGCRTIHTSFVPDIGEDGVVRGYYSFATDMTDRRRAEEASQRHLGELAHVARLATAGEMATGLAHELNQPLAAISIYADACISKLRAEQDQAGVTPILAELNKQVHRAGEIVRRIRQYVRKERVARVRSNIGELASDVVALLATELTDAGVKMTVDVQGGIADVYVDPVQIQQVLLNLAKNAIEAIRESESDPQQVKLKARNRRGGLVEVTVEDSGPGISDELASRVFDTFFSTKTEGMGMGLAICRTIVEAHGGQITLIPNQGQGVTFRFTLPRFEEDEKHE